MSLLEGIQAAVPSSTRVVHAEGVKLVTGPRNFMARSVINTTDRSGIPAAVEAARSADVVVLAIGEDAFQSGEGRSQADIGLKGLQEELLEGGPRGQQEGGRRAHDRPPADARLDGRERPAILEAWHGGSQAGHAIADVLFGDYNPSGKLPVAFPRSVGQLPMTYAHKNTGRPGPEPGVTWSPYTDSPNEPLYPFGYGLSYTTFTYSEPKVSAAGDRPRRLGAGLGDGHQRRASGAGVEVAQLYVRDMVGSVTRPGQGAEGLPEGRPAAGPVARGDVHAEGLRPGLLHRGRQVGGGAGGVQGVRGRQLAGREGSRLHAEVGGRSVIPRSTGATGPRAAAAGLTAVRPMAASMPSDPSRRRGPPDGLSRSPRRVQIAHSSCEWPPVALLDGTRRRSSRPTVRVLADAA